MAITIAAVSQCNTRAVSVYPGKVSLAIGCPVQPGCADIRARAAPRL